jgi:hypothetical protein
MQQRTPINSRPCSCCTGHRLLRRRCLHLGQPQRSWPCVHSRWVTLLCQDVICALSMYFLPYMAHSMGHASPLTTSEICMHVWSMHQAEAAAAEAASRKSSSVGHAAGCIDVLVAARRLLAAAATSSAVGGNFAAQSLWAVDDGAALTWLQASLTIQGDIHIGLHLVQLIPCVYQLSS